MKDWKQFKKVSIFANRVSCTAPSKLRSRFFAPLSLKEIVEEIFSDATIRFGSL